MDNEATSIIRRLELEGQAKSQDLVAANSRINDLEASVTDLQKQISDLTGSDPDYLSNESQIDFITKIAASKSKFAKEAQDIIDGLNNV